ncbi:glutathione S-transferase N-terminal domain-containing protein [Patescibacteria group bacterium]|nr:glutathione S-transferase N-terminal domain-containing protein [Patescibacteria group bacterium]MBU1895562.1 glutathione S-transferase N-terminal domain-containing protein [Patescibacteria group bacterium]
MSVIIYTTPTCGFCKHAKAYFEEKGIEFSEIDVARDREKAKEMVEKSGQMGVPVIEINGKMLIGFDPAAIDSALAGE